MAQLTEVCANIKNYFLRGDEDRKTGTFTVTSGTAPLDSLLEGQYFAIFGSVLNNGGRLLPSSLGAISALIRER